VTKWQLASVAVLLVVGPGRAGDAVPMTIPEAAGLLYDRVQGRVLAGLVRPGMKWEELFCLARREQFDVGQFPGPGEHPWGTFRRYGLSVGFQWTADRSLRVDWVKLDPFFGRWAGR